MCEDDLDRGDDETREGEQREDPEIETLKLGVPKIGKTKEEVLGGIIDRYLQLRMDGYTPSCFAFPLEHWQGMVEAIPGEVQVADIGTKVLSAPRLEALKKKMGMEERSEDEKGEKITEEEKMVQDEVGRRAEIPGGVRNQDNAI